MERVDGLYRFLARPQVYNALQQALGAERGRRRFVDEFVRARPGQRVLDIGCGPGELLELLPTGVNYLGYDVNPTYIRSATERYGARGEFRCAAVTETTVDEASFDVVLAVGVLHHLDDAEVTHLMRTAWRALRSGGRLVTSDGAYTAGQSPLARFFISRDRGLHVRTREGYERLARETFADVKVNVVHDLIRIPYTHLFLECTKP